MPIDDLAKAKIITRLPLNEAEVMVSG
jgi:hypothetical protein